MAELCDDDVNILTIKPINIKTESEHGSGSLHISTIQEENNATADSESPLFNVFNYPDEICENNHTAKSDEMDYNDCSVLIMPIKEEFLHSDNSNVCVTATEINIKQENHNDTNTVEMGYDVCDVSQLTADMKTFSSSDIKNEYIDIAKQKQQCNRNFTKASRLKRHIMTHTCEKRPICGKRKKNFTHVNARKRPMIIHSGEKPHACTQYNKRFIGASSMKRHMMLHSGEKLHTYPKCNKSFSQANALMRHMRPSHSGEKPHTCPQCNKSFTQASDLKRPNHSGEKPHTCPQCNKSFTDDQPSGDRSGVTFQHEIRTSWNPPKTYVDLNSPGVVLLDTTIVPDVLGLHAFNEEAALVRVLPGASLNIVRVLVPDDRAEPRGFHDLLIEDMSATIVRPASAEDLTELRQQWPSSLLSFMTKRQVDMEHQRRECKRQFGIRPGKCPHCGTYISLSLSRHVMSFHLDLGQLWRCPIPWCSVWKGAAQDCVDHLRLRHYTGSSVKASTLGTYFPPWTVTRSAWAIALGARVSGIATDVMLFSQHGARLVHRYHVFASSMSHQSLRGSFMKKLSDFTHHASAEDRSAFKRGRDSSAESTPLPLRPAQTPPTPLGPAHRTLDHAPPARKAARAAATVTSTFEASADAPAFDYHAPMAPAVNLSPSGQPRPTLQVSLPLHQLAVSAPGPAPAPAQSPTAELVTQESLSGSCTSTTPYELLSTDSEDAMSDHAPATRNAACASAIVTSTAGMAAVAPVLTQPMLRPQIPDCCAPMTPAVGPVSPGLPRPTLKVSLPDPAQSPADAFVTQVAAAVPPADSPIVVRFGPLNLPESQELRLSSVQLSPNVDVDTEDIYPMFDTSPVSVGDLPLMSPATTRESISPDTSWNNPPKTYVDLNSPGVVVLDTTVVPDVLGLHAFNEEAALVRVLPGASPNIVRVLVPDDLAEPRGFHDILIEDMSAMIVPPASVGDLTELRQKWPPSVLSGMTKRQVDMEHQRWECKRQFGNRPGKCPHCGTYSLSLSRHIISFHLDLGQLWRCPIPWCSVWKGSAQDCVDHLRLRHYARSSVKASTLGTYFPPWTVTRSAWATALGARVSGIATDVMLFSQHGARLVHQYHVFANSMSHQSLRGSFMTKLSDFTHQASAEARSAAKRGHDSIAASTPLPLRPAQTPLAPAHSTPDHARKAARAAATVTSMSVLQSPNHVPPDIDVDTEDLYPMFDTSPVSDGDLSLMSTATTPESISPDSEGEAESFHSAGNSPATPASMSITHCNAELQLLSPPPAPLPSSIQVETDPGLLPQPPPDPVSVSSPSLFREGPFDAATCSAATTEHPLITNQRDGCPYRFTSYRDYEHTLVDTPFGVQVHHPQFLEWVGAPESARLLGRPPAEWLQVMSREETMHAALQLQRDASLMTSNLTVMQQYAISLHRTASDILQSVFGQQFFPSAAVNAAAPVPRVLRASTHLAAMGLWRPPNGPGGPGLEVIHQGPQCPGCPTCLPHPSGS